VVWICRGCEFQFTVRAGKIAEVPSIAEYQREMAGDDLVKSTSDPVLKLQR
jgi:hypothetical protein